MKKSNVINSAIRVLDAEIKGLDALKLCIDNKFMDIIELLHAIPGKVILSGMGKSGHIATKIAATFTSTGTPAIFVHPGEASHGDLGVITKGDVVILLSNSGETQELSDIIHYTKRFSIPLIAIVRKRNSKLVEAADLSIVLPEIPEASPIGAPTTSTTMMLVLGDAIAISLLEKRGFTKDDFKLFHPGGNLGKQLTKVSELMRKGNALPIINGKMKMSEVLVIMTRKSLGCAVVTDKEGELKGMITDGDLRRHMGLNIIKQKAKDVMTENPITVSPNMLAIEALGIMNKKSITTLCVVENDILVGMLHIHDILGAGVA